MVLEEHTGRPAKVAKHPRDAKRDTIITANGRVYAQCPSVAAIELWSGVTNRTNERIEIDTQGVVLLKDGKRHVLYLWGTDPGVYLPH